MPNGPPMTLAEQTGRRLLLAGLATHPAIATWLEWNRAVYQRAAAKEADR